MATTDTSLPKPPRSELLWRSLKGASSAAELTSVLSSIEEHARQENVAALNVLWEIYSNGFRDGQSRLVIHPNQQRARRYEARAAQLGDPGSMTAIADRLCGRLTSKRNLLAAQRLYQAASRRGYETASYNMAALYRRLGKYRSAVRWYRKALEAGDDSALLPLAHAELLGLGLRRNAPAAIAKLKRLISSKAAYYPGSWIQIQAMLVIANAYLAGWVIPEGSQTGVRWLKAAARKGSAVAAAMLAEPTW